MATLKYEYYPTTGEFIVHVDDGKTLASACNDDGRMFLLVQSLFADICWIEPVGRKGFSVIQPRSDITLNEFKRWVNDSV